MADCGIETGGLAELVAGTWVIPAEKPFQVFFGAAEVERGAEALLWSASAGSGPLPGGARRGMRRLVADVDPRVGAMDAGMAAGLQWYDGRDARGESPRDGRLVLRASPSEGRSGWGGAGYTCAPAQEARTRDA